MKKILSTLAFLAAFTAACAAADARRTTERLAELFRAMPSYTVTFTVETGDFVQSGSYTVEGDRFHLRLGDAELYSDGKTRYEVDPEKREVVADRIDTSSRNLLNNPTRAFDFLDDAFVAEVAAGNAVVTTLRLTPTDPDAAMTSVEVEVETATARPRLLVYRLDGDRVTVRILKIAEGGRPERFDRSRYRGFEFIDFR